MVITLPVQLIAFAWLAGEFGLQLRDRLRGKGSWRDDRGSKLLIGLSLGATAFGAGALAAVAQRTALLRLPGPSQLWNVAGIVLMVLGLALRAWAVVVLGRSFRTTVEVDDDQQVVDRGPYRVLRHPSYSGLMLLVVGFGVATGCWASALLTLVLPLAALLRRIVVEEQVLLRTLGAPYADYRARTWRLVPGVW